MITVKMAAARLGVSDSLIYEWCTQHLLPHYRFGRPGRRGKIMINPAELDAFIAAHRHEAGALGEELPLKHIRMNHG